MTLEEFIADKRLSHEAREWLIECSNSLDEEKLIRGMSLIDVYKSANRHWDGGIDNFAAEMQAYHAAYESYANRK